MVSGYKHKKYCTAKCRSLYYQNKIHGGSALLKHLPPGTVGALGEILVSADLMKKGYEVYRAMSPSSSCDVLARKNEKFYSVEVRTGYKSLDGSKVTTNRVNIKADILAIVLHREGEILYQPEF
jgi:hypothetical protein